MEAELLMASHDMLAKEVETLRAELKHERREKMRFIAMSAQLKNELDQLVRKKRRIKKLLQEF